MVGGLFQLGELEESGLCCVVMRMFEVVRKWFLVEKEEEKSTWVLEDVLIYLSPELDVTG